MAREHHWEDFAVGQVFRSRSVRMERGRIVEFAEEFDPQPQHLGEEAAARSQFGQLVASGWHTAAASMRLFTEALPPVEGGLQGMGIEELAWPNPVRAGDELRVEVEVVETRTSRSRPDKGLLTLRAVTLNGEGAAVMTATHVVMAPRRPAG